MKTQFITDNKGNKISIILPIKNYEKMLDELEELEDIKAYDRAKALKSNPIPYEKAVKELDQLRKKHV